MVMDALIIQAKFEDLASRPASAMAKVFTDEVERALDRAESTAVEFGATADQLPRIFGAIQKAAKANNRTFAEAAKAFEKLVDESEDTEYALDNVSEAMRRASRDGKKVEDAARDMGRGFKEAQNRATPLATSFNRADSALADLGLGFVSSKQVLLAFTAAVVAAGAATLKFAKDSIGAAIKASPTLTREVKELTTAYDKLKVSTGKAIIEQTGMVEVMDDLVLIFDALTENGSAAAEALDDFAGGAKLIASGALSVVTGPLVAIASNFIDVDNAIRGAISSFREWTQVVNMGPRSDDAPFGLSGTEKKDLKAERDKQGKEWEVMYDGLLKEEESARKKAEAEFEQRNRDMMKRLNKPVRAKSGGGAGKASVEGSPLAAAMTAARGGVGGAVGEADEWNALYVDTREAQDISRRRLVAGSASALGEGVRGVQSLAASQEFVGALEEAREVGRDTEAWVQTTDGAFQSLAAGGISAATGALSGLIETAASGEMAFGALGAALLVGLGDMLVNFGEGLVLAASGVAALEAGLLSPAAAIGIGLGAIALGASLKGFTKRSEAPGGGASTAAAGGAIERRFRDFTNRPEDREGRVVYLNVDGREFRGYTEDVVNHGHRSGRIPVTPRRAT